MLWFTVKITKDLAICFLKSVLKLVVLQNATVIHDTRTRLEVRKNILRKI